MLRICAPVVSMVFHVLQHVVNAEELIVTMPVKRLETTWKILTTEAYLKHYLVDN